MTDKCRNWRFNLMRSLTNKPTYPQTKTPVAKNNKNLLTCMKSIYGFGSSSWVIGFLNSGRSSSAHGSPSGRPHKRPPWTRVVCKLSFKYKLESVLQQWKYLHVVWVYISIPIRDNQNNRHIYQINKYLLQL